MVGTLLRESNTQRARERSEAILRQVGLHDQANRVTKDLCVPSKKRLEIAMALATDREVLMLDEAMAGLNMVEEIVRVINQVLGEDTTILLVEQKAREALELADQAYVLQTGRIVLAGTGNELLRSELVQRAYMGM